MEIGGDTVAHAHAGEWGRPSQDWICLASWAFAFADGGPGEVLKHEASHLLNPHDGHGPQWQETFEALLKWQT